MLFGPISSVKSLTQAPLTRGTFTDQTSGLIRPGNTSREMRSE